MFQAFIADAQRKGFKKRTALPAANARRRKQPEWARVFSV
jgi:hypothetical protein